MEQFKCQITNLSRDFATGQAVITLTADNRILKELEQLVGKVLTCVLKLFRKQRSLDANAYCWVLLDKLSVCLNLPKEELYRGYIRQMGGNNTVVCVQDEALIELCEKWSFNGLGWQYDTLDSKIDGCTNVILYYGSSSYDTEQMSRLINLIVEDCKACDIETRTPDEIAEMLARWGENE